MVASKLSFTGGNKMKYSVGNIVCLNDGRTVYIFSVDEKEQKYCVSDTEKENDVFFISEGDIYMLLT